MYDRVLAQAIGTKELLSADQRRAITASLARLRAIPARNRFALVDIATQRLWMFENGRPVDSMKVVVGNLEQKTPLISSTIYYATHQPYWHVPDHLVQRTIGPNIRRQGASYMRRQGYEIVDRWANDAQVIDPTTIDWNAALRPGGLKVRQLPGPANSMGDFKFNFPNELGIYLHDTPAREHFAKDSRLISNGCVRLEDADRFARWLYAGQAVPQIDTTETHDQLPAATPVFLTYLTAQAVDGDLTFVSDVYGLDS
nr:L,D-transpeptidase family protein [Sphingomicrobium sediminis]